MRLPRYASYRAWEGADASIPSHWSVSRISRLASINDNALPEDSDPAIEIEYADIGSVSLGRGIHQTEQFMFAAAPSRARRLVRDGDIIVSTVRTYLKAIAPIDKENAHLVVSTGFAVVRPKARLASAFAKFALQSTRFVDEVISRSTGVSYPAINATDLARIEIPTPPAEEQVLIAAFLDRESAKIDALIAEQERLLTLLAEKRQAVISHAVTKGLNPDAEAKDSGVAWLGSVPAHWEVKALKHVVSTPITDGPHETPNFPDGGIPFVSAEAVSSGAINFDKIRGYISIEDHERYSHKYRPQLHDIYMVKSGATTGVTAIVETDVEFNIWSPLAAIRCDREMANPYFVLAALRSRNFQEGVALNWSFGTQQNIGMGVLGDLPIALPPLSEQNEVVQAIGKHIPAFEALSAEAGRVIDLLKERRLALIAAAVTGQIDVRDRA